MRRFIIGLAGGFTLGYALVRAAQAFQDLRTPLCALTPDPRAYGKQRRVLMLTGLARSMASLATIAFEIAPRLERETQQAKRSSTARMALIATTMIVGSALDLGVDYIESHVLERRYALTQQSAGAWLTDHGKQLGVSIVIFVPLVELFCRTIERAPRWWIIITSLGIAPLLILANLIAPLYIAPLFNRFEPLEGPLAQRLRALAARYGVGEAAILRVDMSRQTKKVNAYVTGLFTTHRIVIGDTLLADFTDDEITFVIAHELGHYVNHDTWRFVGLGTATGTAMLFFSRALAQRSTHSLTSPTGLARLLFFTSLSSLGLTPLITATSRARERAADNFALGATNAPQVGIAAFERMQKMNLSEDEQPRWMQLLFSTHPSLRSRIKSLERFTSR